VAEFSTFERRPFAGVKSALFNAIFGLRALVIAVAIANPLIAMSENIRVTLLHGDMPLSPKLDLSISLP
jgi:hypothetical protein